MSARSTDTLAAFLGAAGAIAEMPDAEILAVVTRAREVDSGSRDDWDAELRQCLAAVADAHRRIAALAGVEADTRADDEGHCP